VYDPAQGGTQPIDGNFENDKGRIKAGDWIAPNGAARVLNNYMAPGLHGFAPYDAIHWVTNAINSAQLGLSAFHMGTTSLNALVSKSALGLEQLSRGAVVKGSVNIAKGLSPTTLLETGFKGHGVIKEYFDPGSTGSPNMALAVQAIKDAGGKVGLDPLDSNSAIRQFKQAWNQHKYASAATKAPFALIEASIVPTMEWVVPRLKLGAYAELAADTLDRLGPSASLDAKREALGKAWDSIDNRFGQLAYDNLGWNRVTRDLAQIAFRSAGWNLGTIRELGGAVPDTLSTVGRVKSGGSLLTHRQAYTIALPAVVGLYGAIYQYAHTGEWPKEIDDYFHPQNGRGERVNLPSYMKDVYTWTHQAPGKTLANKANPAVSAGIQFMQNKDYYNRPIIKPGHSAAQKAGDVGKFVGGQFLPFTVQEAMQSHDRGEGKEQQAERFMGLTPIHGKK
jgi:hypothetical protein